MECNFFSWGEREREWESEREREVSSRGEWGEEREKIKFKGVRGGGERKR